MIGRSQRGFTLIELVVTLVVAGIVVAFMSLFMVAPVQGYLAQSRRAELTDAANNAMRVLSNDIHAAVPESFRFVRNGPVVAIQMIETIDVARYRRAGTSGVPTQELDFGPPGDGQFNLLRSFERMQPFDRRDLFLVVGYTGGNYPGTGQITPVNQRIVLTRPVGTNEDQITLLPAVTFTPGTSDNIFLVSGPVTYLCDETPGVNTLTRYSNHPIAPTIASYDSAAELAGFPSSVVARDVAACGVNYAQGTAQRGGLAMIQITLSRNGENVRVMQQVQVDKRP